MESQGRRTARMCLDGVWLRVVEKDGHAIIYRRVEGPKKMFSRDRVIWSTRSDGVPKIGSLPARALAEAGRILRTRGGGE